MGDDSAGINRPAFDELESLAAKYQGCQVLLLWRGPKQRSDQDPVCSTSPLQRVPCKMTLPPGSITLIAEEAASGLPVASITTVG